MALSNTRCHDCGRYIRHIDMASTAKHHFVPLNEFGPEESWWTCAGCSEPISKGAGPVKAAPSDQ